MAFGAPVQSTQGISATASATATFGATPKQGNLIIASCAVNKATHPSVNDGGTFGSGNAFTTLAFTDVTGHSFGIYALIAGASQSTSVTGGFSTSTSTKLAIYEFTGNQNSYAVDSTNSLNAGTTTSFQVATLAGASSNTLTFFNSVFNNIQASAPTSVSGGSLTSTDGQFTPGVLFDAYYLSLPGGIQTFNINNPTSSVTRWQLVTLQPDPTYPTNQLIVPQAVKRASFR